LTALDRDAAYFTFVEYIKIFAMFGASIVLIQNVHQIWVLFVTTGCTLAYIAYEVNFLYLASGYLGIYKNGYGGLDNNGAALMLAMGVPVCFFIWMGMKRWLRWSFLAMIPVLLHAVLMTYSRGAMVALLVAAPLMLMRSREWVKGGICCLIIALVVPVLAGREIRDRFFTIAEYEVDASAQSRRGSWEAAWRMAMDHPVFGVGIRNANLLSHSYGADVEGRTIHSQYLQIAADGGFVGLALYVAIMISAWLALHRCRQHAINRTDEEGWLMLAITNGVESSLAIYLVGAALLSLEVFELPYLLILLSAQLAAVSEANEKMAIPSSRLESEPGLKP
jgi:probable O-glycosylation ligase (exosortase A-associated)